MGSTNRGIKYKIYKWMALISLSLGLVNLLLILNFIFKLTPFQYLVDLPILIGLLISPILFITALISLKKTGLRIAKISIFISILIFSTLPILFLLGILQSIF